MALFRRNEKRQVLELPITDIRPNPNQPRQEFEPNALDELSRSIAQLGILQPLSVRKTPVGWELISGERRLRAAELAGLTCVPCLPVEVDEETSSLLALVENLQRKDLSVWEEAAALRQLIDHYHLSQEEVAKRVGKSQSAVANKLRLLKLPADIISKLQTTQLTERHARALLRLENPDCQRAALSHILFYNLNVAKTEEYIDRLCAKAPSSKKATPVYRFRDVRLFLNTIKRSLAVMQSAGVNARCGREETDNEITLTIHIPKEHPAQRMFHVKHPLFLPSLPMFHVKHPLQSQSIGFTLRPHGKELKLEPIHDIISALYLTTGQYEVTVFPDLSGQVYPQRRVGILWLKPLPSSTKKAEWARPPPAPI